MTSALVSLHHKDTDASILPNSALLYFLPFLSSNTLFLYPLQRIQQPLFQIRNLVIAIDIKATAAADATSRSPTCCLAFDDAFIEPQVTDPKDVV
jgi:hypothetical protein